MFSRQRRSEAGPAPPASRAVSPPPPPRPRQGWEAAERGEDPKSLPNHHDLYGPALELAVRVGSKSTTVIQARQDGEFRTKGLLPQFTAANQKIASSVQQVCACARGAGGLASLRCVCRSCLSCLPVPAPPRGSRAAAGA